MNLVNDKIEMELKKIYRDPSKLIELWNRTQVREPYSIDEVEELFYDL